MVKICAIADLHGNLCEIPACDLLIIAGDICPPTIHSVPLQRCWLEGSFNYWLKSLKCDKIIGIWGNHDWIGLEKSYIPPLNWTLLEDSGVEYKGIKIWGSPWQPIFYNWAFNLSENDLEKKWALIPDDTDVLTVHGPPLGYGDLTKDYVNKKKELIPGKHVGSPSLTARIKNLPNLKVSIHGHIHPGYGKYYIGEKLIINASLVDESYKIANSPILVEV